MDYIESKNKKTKIILFVTVALLAVAVAVLSTLLGINIADNNVLLTNAENGYRSSYYTLTDSILQIENNLSKMRVVRTAPLQAEILNKVCIQAEIAEQCLSHLSLGNSNMQSTIKFCNQVQDYCLYLLSKINKDESLSDTDYSLLNKLYSSSYQLGVKLNSLKDSMITDGYSFVDYLGEQDDAFSAIVEDIANGSIEYPALIYDGPFSDGLEDPTPKTLDGEQITQEQGQQMVTQYMSDYELQEVNFEGESTGYFDCLNYSFKDKNGIYGYVQLSKAGGHLVMFDVYDDVTDPKFTQEDAVNLAVQYCQKQGYDNMTPVWSSVTDSQLYVNLCYEQDSIIFYPDMVKIKVSLQTGKITGFESLEYIYNHDSERDTDYNVEITEEEVLSGQYGEMTVKSVRLCVIPVGGGQEKLVYEVYGLIDEYKFFVYVDCVSGQEVKVLQVIDSDEGELLM